MYTRLLLLALGLFTGSAHAWNCTTLQPSTLVSPQNVTISRHLPVGSLIGTQIVTPPVGAFSCIDHEDGIIANQTFGIRAYGTFDSMLNGRRIYKTSVPGVGYSISGITSHCAGGTGSISGSNTIRGQADTLKLCESTDGMVAPLLTANLLIAYFKIAAETGSGTVSGGPVGAFVLLSNLVIMQEPDAVVSINPFTITTPACTLTTTTIPVDMKEVPKTHFNGKDSTPGDSHTRAFTLPMSCNAGTKVSVKMEGDIFDATKGVINVASGAGAATGVGIQLLYNDRPMPLGADIPVGDLPAGGSLSVPLKARYYQTGNSIGAGKANGMLAFTMTYD
nr:fimbrial protein [uncultured Enterobacter sp.]